MRLYDELVHTYSLLTPRHEYAEEAAAYEALIRDAVGDAWLALLELGCGAGHTVSWFEYVDRTLVDLSPKMLALAKANNPDATCVEGDMRTVRLEQDFDAVLVHDALGYLIGEADLRATMKTAFDHLRPGGVAMFVPDFVSETFEEGAEHGGDDGDGEGVRYVSWVWQRAGETDRYVADYAIMHRVGEAVPQVHQDRHEEGLFPRQSWHDWLAETGFEPVWHGEVEEGASDVFVVRRPA